MSNINIHTNYMYILRLMVFLRDLMVSNLWQVFRYVVTIIIQTYQGLARELVPVRGSKLCWFSIQVSNSPSIYMYVPPPTPPRRSCEYILLRAGLLDLRHALTWPLKPTAYAYLKNRTPTTKRQGAGLKLGCARWMSARP